MVTESGPDPAPFLFVGGPGGILLLHGLTGAPAEMRPLGQALQQCGLTVTGSLLPGHGSTVEALETFRWEDRVEHAQAALRDLQARCATVFVGGSRAGVCSPCT